MLKIKVHRLDSKRWTAMDLYLGRKSPVGHQFENIGLERSLEKTPKEKTLTKQNKM